MAGKTNLLPLVLGTVCILEGGFFLFSSGLELLGFSFGALLLAAGIGLVIKSSE